MVHSLEDSLAHWTASATARDSSAATAISRAIARAAASSRPCSIARTTASWAAIAAVGSPADPTARSRARSAGSSSDSSEASSSLPAGVEDLAVQRHVGGHPLAAARFGDGGAQPFHRRPDGRSLRLVGPTGGEPRRERLDGRAHLVDVGEQTTVEPGTAAPRQHVRVGEAPARPRSHRRADVRAGLDEALRRQHVERLAHDAARRAEAGGDALAVDDRPRREAAVDDVAPDAGGDALDQPSHVLTGAPAALGVRGGDGAPVSRRPCLMVRSLEGSLAHAGSLRTV